MSELYVRNRQSTRRIHVPVFRKLAARLLEEIGVVEFELGILFVNDREMARLNEDHLRHAGSTDVLAFDYGPPGDDTLQGEIFICVDEALRQARRFRTNWEQELIRYLVHGMLHLQGYRDSTKARRTKMKKVENALVRRLAKDIAAPARSSSGAARIRT